AATSMIAAKKARWTDASDCPAWNSWCAGASVGLIGRTWAIIPSARTMSASHSCGYPGGSSAESVMAPVWHLTVDRRLAGSGYGAARGDPAPPDGAGLRPRPSGAPRGRAPGPGARRASPERGLLAGVGLRGPRRPGLTGAILVRHRGRGRRGGHGPLAAG